MKLRRAYPLLAGAALLGAVAAYFEMARTTAQPSDRPVNSSEADAQRASPRAPPAAARERPAPSGNPLWTLPLKQLSITRERPIFSPSRRPPPLSPRRFSSLRSRPGRRQNRRSPTGPPLRCSAPSWAAPRGSGFSSNRRHERSYDCGSGKIIRAGSCVRVKRREVTLAKGPAQPTVLELPPPGGDAAMLANDPTPEPCRFAGRRDVERLAMRPSDPPDRPDLEGAQIACSRRSAAISSAP